MDNETQCPFCVLSAGRIEAENEAAVWIFDGYPVSPGHSLIIPKRHVGSFFETTASEQLAILSLLGHARASIGHSHKPDGYNIGINDGSAAGQTVPHLHLHLIPRYAGDCADPRGGVRWIFPQKADYWTRS